MSDRRRARLHALFDEPTRFSERPEWHLHFYDPQTRIGAAIQGDADGECYYIVRGRPEGGAPIEMRFVHFEPSYDMGAAVRMGRAAL